MTSIAHVAEDATHTDHAVWSIMRSAQPCSNRDFDEGLVSCCISDPTISPCPKKVEGSAH